MPRTEGLTCKSIFEDCMKTVMEGSGRNGGYEDRFVLNPATSPYGQSVASTHSLSLKGKRLKKEREEFYKKIKEHKEKSRQSQYHKNSPIPLIGCQNGRLKIAPSDGVSDWWREQE